MGIRNATMADLDKIVTVHMNAFSGFFLEQMGKAFVRFYYKKVLEYGGGIVFVFEMNKEIVGFVAGFFDSVSFYEFYKQEKYKLYYLTLVSALKKPKLLPRVIYNALKIKNNEEPDRLSVELSSIGVLQQAKGKGIGRDLLEHFIDASSQEGKYKYIYLTTDAINNDPVNRFYSNNGFCLDHSFYSQKRKMNLYKHIIRND